MIDTGTAEDPSQRLTLQSAVGKLGLCIDYCSTSCKSILQQSNKDGTNWKQVMSTSNAKAKAGELDKKVRALSYPDN